MYNGECGLKTFFKFHKPKFLWEKLIYGDQETIIG